jgi:hypothetical protein
MDTRTRYQKISDSLRKPLKYTIEGNTAVCIASTGAKFYVDAEDIDKISDRTWTIANGGYPCAKFFGIKEKISLHNFIMGVNDSNVFVDHKDRDKMNNRKSNLRICTRAENALNYGTKSNNTSGFTGVYLIKRSNKWQAIITKNKKVYHLGCFDNYHDAVIARFEAEQKLYGEFAPHTYQDVLDAIRKHEDKGGAK